MMVVLFALFQAASVVAAPAQPAPALIHRPMAAEGLRRFAIPERIFAIAQDRRGFLWLGGAAGLHRFDGANVRSMASTGDHAIVALAFGADDVLWIGLAEGGVQTLNNGRLSAVASLAGAGTRIRDLMVDASGTLWILSERGLFAGKNGRAQPTQPSGDGSAHATVLALRNVGGVPWISTSHGIYRFDGTFKQMAPDTDAMAFDVDGRGRIWILTSAVERLRVRDGASVRSASEPVRESFTPPDRSNRIAARPEGLTIAAENGLFWTDGNIIESRALAGMPASMVTDVVATDRAGSTWITSGTNLIATAASPLLRTWWAAGQDGPDAVFSVAVDSRGDLWGLTRLGLQKRRRDEPWQVFPIPESLRSFDYRSLAIDRNGSAWFCSSRDGDLMQFTAGRYRRHDRRATGVTCASVFQDRQGDLWIGRTGGGIARLVTDPVRVVPVTGSDAACPGAPAAFADAAEHGFWFVTPGSGLCLFDGSAVHRWNAGGGAATQPMLALTRDRSGVVWLGGAETGLAVVRDGKLSVIPPSSGLGVKIVYGIVEDAAGFLWLSSHDGLFRVPRADLLEFLDGQRQRVRVLQLGMRDGLESTVFIGAFPGNAVATADGTLYFTNLRGLVQVNDPAHAGTRELPEMVLDRVQVNGTDVGDKFVPGAQPAIAVPAGDGRLEVAFAAAALENAHRVRFSAFLDGFDQKWHDVDAGRALHYETIPPGSYTLRLAAHTTDRDDRKVLSLPLVLTPPLHATRTFRVAAGVAIVTLLLVLIFFFHRLRLWNERKRFAAIADERTRIARDMHDTLEQSLMGMRMQLEALQEASGDEAAVTAHANQVREMLMQALRDAKSSVWALRSGLSAEGDLVPIVSALAGSALRGTDIRLSVASTGEPFRLQAVAQQHLVRVLQEGLTNALKHAHPKAIDISLTFSGDGLQVRLTDNGRGFDVISAAGANLGHFGLTGMRERAAQIGASLDIKSADGAGTTVTFTVPARHRRADGGRK